MSLAEVDSEPLSRLAAALSSQPAELVAAVRLAAGRELPDVLESPERLRRLTVHTLLRGRRPVEVAESFDGVPLELIDLARRVAALPPLERAVLVLLDLEHLTRAEVAGIVDRPVATVGHLRDRLYADLEADPYALAAVLAALSWQPVDPAAVRRAETTLTRGRRRRTRRRGLVAAAALVAVAAVVLPGVLRTTPSPTVFIRGHRDWVLSFRLTPPIGYQIDSRTVTADTETTVVTRSSGTGRCQITVGQDVDDSRVSRNARDEDEGRAVQVQNQPARIVSRDGQSRLRWRPGLAIAAEVSCTGMADAEPFARELAEKMIFEAEPILLPYRLGPLPSHFHVDQVTMLPQQRDTVVDLWPDEVAPTGVPITLSQTHPSTSYTTVPTLAIYGMSVCKLVGDVSVCAGIAAPGAVDAPAEQRRTEQRLKMIMAGMTMIASADDDSTWVDARESLPHD